MPMPTPIQRVLTVGDGNFSFSLSLVQALTNHIDLTATCYDFEEELLQKYPESKSIINQLNRFNVTRLHRIDACNLQHTLSHALHTKSKSISSHTNPDINSFDKIIFNHPHSGEENLKRHQSLLSHFFHSAKDVISLSGEVHLSLALHQIYQWGAVERAEWEGFTLIDCRKHSEMYDFQYEIKRHQSGKSFKRVCMHGKAKEYVSYVCVFGQRGGKSAFVPAIEEEMTVTAEVEAEVYKCPKCQKVFPTAQGSRTHFRQVHEIEERSSVKMAFLCEECDRVFASASARREHFISKHSLHKMILPDWMNHSDDQKDPKEECVYRCEVCRFDFDSSTAREMHEMRLVPNNKKKIVVCSLCNAEFDQIRAMKQHENYCRLRREANGLKD